MYACRLAHRPRSFLRAADAWSTTRVALLAESIPSGFEPSAEVSRVREHPLRGVEALEAAGANVDHAFLVLDGTLDDEDPGGQEQSPLKLIRC